MARFTKFKEFFGAECYWGQADWDERNHIAAWLTKRTCEFGVVGGLTATVAGLATGVAGVAIGGIAGVTAGLFMLVPTLKMFYTDKDKDASLTMKGLVSLGYAAKNTVAWPVRKIKEAIKQRHDDYNITYTGPYHD